MLMVITWLGWLAGWKVMEAADELQTPEKTGTTIKLGLVDGA